MIESNGWTFQQDQQAIYLRCRVVRFCSYGQLNKLLGRGGVGEFNVKITIAHMLNVTLLYVHLQLRTCWMLRYVHFMQLGPARQLVAQHRDPAEGKVEASFV